MTGDTDRVWIGVDLALAIHNRQIAEHGGDTGVRDLGLLESALARPRHAVAYEDADIARCAALYGHGVALNHPFVDGNKRVALVVMRTFIRLNGHNLRVEPIELYEMMMKLASGNLAIEPLTTWIRERLVEC